MATAWPTAYIPTALEVDYTEEALNNILATEPEAGARLTRKRFSAVPRKISGSMTLTSAQKDSLDQFYSDEVGRRFSWTNNIRGALRYYSFAEPPQYSMLSALTYKVTLTLWEFTTEFGGA